MIVATHGADTARFQQDSPAYSWVSAGTFHAAVGFYFDPLSAVMLNVVTGVGLLITDLQPPGT